MIEQKNIFLQSDIDQLKKYETKIDDEILGGTSSVCSCSFRIYKKRVSKQNKIYKEFLPKPFDFSKDETVT